MAMVRTGIEEMARVRDVIGRFLPDSPITKRLADVRAPFVGGTCSLTLERDRVRSAGIQLQPLVQAEEGYWGEVDYNSDDPAKLQYDANRDHGAPNFPMRPRTTIVLLLLVVAVGAFIRFYESKRPNTEEASRRAQNVINFDRDKIEGIVIQNGDERIELKRVDKKWRLESPVKDLADSSVVESLLFDLEDWKKEATITGKEMEADKNKMADYGLTKAKL